MTVPNEDRKTKSEAEITPPSYALKTKAPETDRDLDAALGDAEEAVTALAQDYEEWVREDLAKLDSAYRALCASGGARDDIAVVFGIAHDMLGQGGSFGYPMISTVGKSLCSLLKDREKLDDRLLDATAVHIDSMRLIVARPLKGDGGPEGAKLVAELEKVREKVGA